MADIKLFAPKLLVHEGGFVNDPKDPGGATMKGVTIRVYENYWKRKGLGVPTIEDLKKITDQEWSDILKFGYWDKIKADEILNQSIAEIIVDWIYNSGPGMVKNIQRLLGLTADGIAGPKTIDAINSSNQAMLHNSVWLARRDYYNAIVKRSPGMNKFLLGWTNRLNTFKYEPTPKTGPEFELGKDKNGNEICIIKDAA